MFTKFHALSVFFSVFGACSGFCLGAELGDPYAAYVLAGAGVLTGPLFFTATRLFFGPRFIRSFVLRTRVRADRLYARIALPELVRRGERIDDERIIVRELLLSDEPRERSVGHLLLTELLPGLAEALGPYDPAQLSAESRARIDRLSW